MARSLRVLYRYVNPRQVSVYNMSGHVPRGFILCRFFFAQPGEKERQNAHFPTTRSIRCRIMLAMQVTLTPTPDADTAAAVIAAIACVIAPETANDPPDALARSAWHAADALVAQGMPPTRNGAFATWCTAERARRAARWSGGIVGI